MDLEKCPALGTSIMEEIELKFGLEGRVRHDITASKYCQKCSFSPAKR